MNAPFSLSARTLAISLLAASPFGAKAATEGEKLFTGYIRDISEQQANALRLNEMQVELANFSRLSAVGTMASAMAHELNQPLTSIMGYAELMQRKMPADAPNRRYLDLVVEQTERLAQIVAKLSSITRYKTKKYVGETEILDLDASAVRK